MAPPAPSTTTKGTNPAPDYNLLMNKIALTFGDRTDSLELMRQHRASAAAISAKAAAVSATSSHTTGNDTSASTGNFSSLQRTATKTKAQPTPSLDAQKRGPNTQANLVAEAAQFALEHGAAPNAGIGFAPQKKLSDQDTPGRDGDMAQQDRSTQALRARLLGRKGLLAARRGDADAAGAARRKKHGGRLADSSDDDDEPGRSGLGREKKKRRRSESEGDMKEQELGEDLASAEKPVGSIEANIPCQVPSRLRSLIDDNVDATGTGMLNSVIASRMSMGSEEGRKRKKKKRQKKAKQDKAG